MDLTLGPQFSLLEATSNGWLSDQTTWRITRLCHVFSKEAKADPALSEVASCGFAVRLHAAKDKLVGTEPKHGSHEEHGKKKRRKEERKKKERSSNSQTCHTGIRTQLLASPN